MTSSEFSSSLLFSLLAPSFVDDSWLRLIPLSMRFFCAGTSSARLASVSLNDSSSSSTVSMFSVDPALSSSVSTVISARLLAVDSSCPVEFESPFITVFISGVMVNSSGLLISVF